jgi:hypothetical protein
LVGKRGFHSLFNLGFDIHLLLGRRLLLLAACDNEQGATDQYECQDPKGFESIVHPFLLFIDDTVVVRSMYKASRFAIPNAFLYGRQIKRPCSQPSLHFATAIKADPLK